jgi:hypothetical protein
MASYNAKYRCIERNVMKTIAKRDYLAVLFLMTPVIAVTAFAAYKLALEVWCIAYGLIY